jgi:hypothetical protein
MRTIIAVLAATLTVLLLVASSPLKAQSASVAAVENPVFARGLWRFTRKLEGKAGKSSGLTNAWVKLKDRVLEHCVNPTINMEGIFGKTVIGDCQSDKPTRIGNDYRFAKRCDVLGPTETLIQVHSEHSYTEVNNYLSRALKDTVIAQRLGDCDPVK